MHFGLDRIWFRTNTQQVNRSHVDKGASNYNAEFRDVPIAQIENKEYLLQFKFAARLCSALHLNLSDSAWSDFLWNFINKFKILFQFLNVSCHIRPESNAEEKWGRFFNMSGADTAALQDRSTQGKIFFPFPQEWPVLDGVWKSTNVTNAGRQKSNSIVKP